MQEVWKDIAGYEGLYQVSNLGRVKSLERVVKRKNQPDFSLKERELKQFDDRGGYKTVTLSQCGKLKVFKVHRLVATAFIPNPDNLPMVNHKDENKANNRVENLEWCTNSYNLNYGTLKERQSRYAKEFNTVSRFHKG